MTLSVTLAELVMESALARPPVILTVAGPV